MNRPKENSPSLVSKLKMPSFALAVLLLLASCSGKKESTVEGKIETHPQVAEVVKDNFCADIDPNNFHAGIERKIEELGKEIPVLNKIYLDLKGFNRLRIRFFDENGYINYMNQRGVNTQEIKKNMEGAGAQTWVFRDNTNYDQDIVVYLSPYALANKQNFIEGIINEVLNAYMEKFMPTKLEIKVRTLATQGRLDITPEEIDGLGLELCKEFLSGFFSKITQERFRGVSKTYSLDEIKKNLENGIFHHSDTPGYAYFYFDRILTQFGFPKIAPQELVPLYNHVLSGTWTKMEPNILSMASTFGIEIAK